MAIHMLRNLESKLVRKKLAQVGAHILPAPLFSFEGSFLHPWKLLFFETSSLGKFGALLNRDENSGATFFLKENLYEKPIF